MRHRKNKITLDRTSAQRARLLRNLARSVILHLRMTTTSARARAVRPMVEKLVTLGKTPTLAHRRLMLSILPDAPAVKRVIDVISPKFSSRKGGYIRLTKIAPRQGDNAARMIVEFVETI